jgi:hypothetical protein
MVDLRSGPKKGGRSGKRLNHPSGEGMPTFFVIGASKCGTTSMHSYLDLHPGISMSKTKEPGYFCRHVDDLGLPVVTDRDEYLGLFQPGTEQRGESSTTYSESGIAPGVPEAISREVDEPKFVYLVRDPIERFTSAVREQIASRRSGFAAPGRSVPVSEQGLARMVGDIEDPSNLFLSPGLYMTEIRAYLDFFPADSILVVDSADLLLRRREAMAEVFTFLGLEPVFDPAAMGVELNRGDEKKVVPGPYRSLTRSRHARKAAGLLPEGIRSKLVTGARSLGSNVARPDVEADLRARLENLYRAEVRELREFTGKPFPGWSI